MKYPLWTAKEDNILKRYYGKLHRKTIKNKYFPQFSLCAVSSRAYKLNLKSKNTILTYNKWSKKDLKNIKRYYGKIPLKNLHFRYFKNRTKSSIQAMGRVFGLKYPKTSLTYNSWTVKDKRLFLKYYGKIKVKIFYKKYFSHRTIRSLMSYAHRMGFKSNRGLLMTGKNAPFWKHHHSKKNKQIFSRKAKLRFKDKKNHPFYKRPHSPETCLKLSMINKERWLKIRKNKKEYSAFCKQRSDYMTKNRKKNPFYIDGRGYLPYPKNWSWGFRKKIRKRDKKCAICNIPQEKSFQLYNRTLDVHHVNRNKFDLSSNNLISLCHYCHGRIFCIQYDLQDHFHAKLLGLI